MMTVKELVTSLKAFNENMEVAIAYDSGIRMPVEYVGSAIVKEWDDKFGSKTKLVVITNREEVEHIKELSKHASGVEQ